ncbi:MAG: Rieske 2Fe-2S domain-containing protein, partial [Ilumatobacteraceae bacterium]
MEFSLAERPIALSDRRWPDAGVTRVPFWVYTDVALYEREQERIFRGPSWSYVALAAEIPEAGDFVRTSVGDVPVIVTRDRKGAVHVVVNRC